MQQSRSRRLTRSRRLAVARKWLAFHKRCYEETNNPVHAWDAIGECLSHDFALPKWTREYLLQAAAGITKLSRRSVPEKNAIDRAVAAALGLRARGAFNPFRDAHRPGHELVIACEVYQCHASNPHYSWQAVFAQVAEDHHVRCDECRGKVSAGKVTQCWYAHALEVIPKHLIERAHSKKLDDILR